METFKTTLKENQVNKFKTICFNLGIELTKIVFFGEITGITMTTKANVYFLASDVDYSNAINALNK